MQIANLTPWSCRATIDTPRTDPEGLLGGARDPLGERLVDVGHGERARLRGDEHCGRDEDLRLQLARPAGLDGHEDVLEETIDAAEDAVEAIERMFHKAT